MQPVLPTTLLVSILAHFITDVVIGQRTTEGCQTIEVPMCKGLIDYSLTKLPNRFGHRTQTEVYWAMQPWWPFMDAGCSNNIRRFICAMYVPRCMGDGNLPAQYPCAETCRKAKVRCASQMRRESPRGRTRWPPQFKCSRLLPKNSRRCVRPERERKKNKNSEYVLCERNRLSMCRGIPYTYGSLPNMFLQSDYTEIEREMQQYRFLTESGCSRKLRFFLCGVFMPYCVPAQTEDDLRPRRSSIINNEDDEDDDEEDENNDVQSTNFMVDGRYPHTPYVVPCRELCQEVYEQCSGEYQQRTNGIPWPGKLHCHRYPSYVNPYNDNHITNTTRGYRTQGPSVPCTMPPFNYDGH